jgi:hypothetical protein
MNSIFAKADHNSNRPTNNANRVFIIYLIQYLLNWKKGLFAADGH